MCAIEIHDWERFSAAANCRIVGCDKKADPKIPVVISPTREPVSHIRRRHGRQVIPSPGFYVSWWISLDLPRFFWCPRVQQYFRARTRWCSHAATWIKVYIHFSSAERSSQRRYVVLSSCRSEQHCRMSHSFFSRGDIRYGLTPSYATSVTPGHRAAAWVR